jgi:hypothetical protein
MSNDKSSVEMMWDEIDNLFPFKDSVEAQKFCAILDKYKAMHKEEITQAWQKGDGQFDKVSDKMSLEYYNETYNHG